MVILLLSNSGTLTKSLNLFRLDVHHLEIKGIRLDELEGLIQLITSSNSHIVGEFVYLNHVTMMAKTANIY